ncbi:MAG: N-acetylmuramoyl-L-alanine amidase [Gammaproteobacteria bacterium]
MLSPSQLGRHALWAVLLLCPATALAAQVQVQGIKFVPANGHASLVFNLSGPVQHRIFTLGHPDRVVIDIDSARLATRLPAGQGVVKDLRSGIRHGTDLRVVLDLLARANPQSLLRTGKHGAELVVNLYADSRAPAAHVGPAPRRPVLTAAAAVPDTGRDVVVAIDAGHGGIDSGAIGPGGVMEKTITLQIARKLAALVAETPGYKPFLTRDGDYYLTLRDRIDKARTAHADIFISIHCNASRDHYVQGAAVFALSQHGATSEQARLLAERENDSDLLGGVNLADKSSMLASVLIDLSQTATIGASLDVGNLVAGQLAKFGPMHRDRTQQAAFVVLKSPDIPSILVETDFITNSHEERLLESGWYQEKIAHAVLAGVEHYFNQYPPPGTELAMQKARRGQQTVTAEALDVASRGSGR